MEKGDRFGELETLAVQRLAEEARPSTSIRAPLCLAHAMDAPWPRGAAGNRPLPMEQGYLAESGSTEFGARMLALTDAGMRFRDAGIAWWNSLDVFEKLKVRVFG